MLKLIPFHLPNVLRQHLTETEKLHNDLSVITICLAKLYV